MGDGSDYTLINTPDFMHSYSFPGAYSILLTIPREGAMPLQDMVTIEVVAEMEESDQQGPKVEPGELSLTEDGLKVSAYVSDESAIDVLEWRWSDDRDVRASYRSGCDGLGGCVHGEEDLLSGAYSYVIPGKYLFATTTYVAIYARDVHGNFNTDWNNVIYQYPFDDTDTDGVVDTFDSCPEQGPDTTLACRAVDETGCCILACEDHDEDGDGLFEVEGCTPHDEHPNDRDNDGCIDGSTCNSDGVCDYLQPDSDGDGVIDACDPCPADTLNDQDHDDICDSVDDCPNTPEGEPVDSRGCRCDLFDSTINGCIEPSQENRPPLIQLEDIVVNEGHMIRLDEGISDPDGDAVSIYYMGWKAGEFQRKGYYLTGMEDAGTHDVTVTAFDDKEYTSKDITITVVDVNLPPRMNSINDILVEADEPVSINVLAYDPDGDDLRYSDDSPLFEINQAGVISWTPSVEDKGNHPVVVSVDDGHGHTIRAGFTISVVSEDKVSDQPKDEGIQVLSPENRDYATNSVDIRVSSSVEHDLIAYKLDGGQIETAGDRLSRLEDGKHTIKFYALTEKGPDVEIAAVSEEIVFGIYYSPEPLRDVLVLPEEGSVQDMKVMFRAVHSDRGSYQHIVEIDDTNHSFEDQLQMELPPGPHSYDMYIIGKDDGRIRYHEKIGFVVADDIFDLVSPEPKVYGTRNIPLRYHSTDACKMVLNSGPAKTLLPGRGERMLQARSGENILRIRCGDEITERVFLVESEGKTRLLDDLYKPEEITVPQDLSPEDARRILEEVNSDQDLLEEARQLFEQHRSTSRSVDIEKSISYKQIVGRNASRNHTRITITIVPKRPLFNFSVYEEIPKSFAATADEIIKYSSNWEVIRDDPLIVWHFDELRSPARIEYEVRKEVSVEEINASRTVVVADTIGDEELEVSLWKILLPLLLIPLVAAIVVFFSGFEHGFRRTKLDETEHKMLERLIAQAEVDIQHGIPQAIIRKKMEDMGWPEHITRRAIKIAKKRT